jgi:hypothetical protein
MPTRRRKRDLKRDRVRALELLAASPDGLPEASMLANGFTVAQQAELVREGLASPASERVVAGRDTAEVACMRITDAGRRAVAE